MNKWLFFTAVLALFSSCGNSSEKDPKDLSPEEYRQMREDLRKQNSVWHEQEILDIDDYVARHGWNVITTGTGLRYSIYKKADTSKAPQAREGHIAVINYSISLLNDSTCYSSEGEPDQFLIGMDNVESGLHEGITYMHKGEKAKIILPSNLAFGLVGDLDLIPPQSPLIYDIELVDLLDGETKKPITKKP